MADYDVAVIGGGPAGHAAALAAARAGARVALIEAEEPGGACVHHSCVPTAAMLGAAHAHVAARELAIMGVIEAGEQFSLARAAARKDAMVSHLAQGVRASLRMARVEVIAGRAAFASPARLAISLRDGGARQVSAEAVVIATGTRWEPPAIPGVSPAKILTADAVQRLSAAPPSALVIGDGPADTAFALEYAVLLAVAGTEVAYATSAQRILPALDADVAALARQFVEDLGIAVHEDVAVEGGDQASVRLRRTTGDTVVPAEVVVAADPRVPFLDGLELDKAGIEAGGLIPVDRGCRTNVPGIYAAGDVTGGPMLSSAAMHMGDVAGRNAAGGDDVTRLAAVPHVLHTIPETAWVGMTEEQARAAGHDVVIGAADLSYNAFAVTHGFRSGGVKLVAERRLGQVLGVHAAGPGAAEVIAVAAAMMQAEVALDDLAAMVHWHPGGTEALVEAARRAR
ncbi:MAG: dihydrolipoyl dehydrogenase [Dehalococcoidia bacterium]